MSKPDLMTLSEAIDFIVKDSGKSRRQARAMVLEGIRKGELPARIMNYETGEDLGPCPPEWVPPREH